MNQLRCEVCGKIFPMNGMLKASDRYYCEDCIEAAFQDPDHPLEGEVERQVDPTLCARCGFDNGSTSLDVIAGLPVCRQCEDFFRNRPFPRWIKLSFAALIILVVFSISWNLRFIQAYREMKTSYKFLNTGDI